MQIFPTSNFGFLISNPTTVAPTIHPRTLSIPKSLAETSKSEISEALAILLKRNPALTATPTERSKPEHNHDRPEEARQQAHAHMEELLTIIIEMRVQKRAKRSLEYRFWRERKQRKNPLDLPPNPIPDRSLPEGISFQMAQAAVSQEDANSADNHTSRILQRILRRLPRPGETTLPQLK
jgi:hypothetical protein